MDWMGATIYSFDTETDARPSGIDFEHDEIVQLTIIRYELGKPWSELTGYTATFSSTRGVPAGQQLFCGLTSEDLAGKPTIGECMGSILDILKDGRVFLAFNAPFDLKMLRTALRRSGVPGQLPMTRANTIDPLAFARGLYPNVRGRKLEQMALRVGMRMEHVHESTWDALAAAEIMARMAVQHNLPPDLDGLLLLQERYSREWAVATGRAREEW